MWVLYNILITEVYSGYKIGIVVFIQDLGIRNCIIFSCDKNSLYFSQV